MDSTFSVDPVRSKLHGTVTRQIALQIIEADRRGELIAFPNEAELSAKLGVSRTVVREAMKVLVDKGMVEMRPRAGTKSRPRSAWNLLDPDILGWHAERAPDAEFLLQLCEVRMAIEPTACGLAAVRATPEELHEIAHRLMLRDELPEDAPLDKMVELDWDFFDAVMAASHNALLWNLNRIIRAPFKAALLHTFRSAATVPPTLKAQVELFKALNKKDASGASKAAGRAIGATIVAVQENIAAGAKPARLSRGKS